jgi:hypothetical protein
MVWNKETYLQNQASEITSKLEKRHVQIILRFIKYLNDSEQSFVKTGNFLLFRETSKFFRNFKLHYGIQSMAIKKIYITNKILLSYV